MTWKISSYCSTDGCIECNVSGAAWRNASQNGGSCVDAACSEGAHFTKPRASAHNGNCVAAAGNAGGEVLVRDSKDPDGPHIHVPAAGWDNGAGLEFTPATLDEVPVNLRAIALRRDHQPDQAWYCVTDGTDALWFDQAEADAFRKGVASQEFALA